MLDNAASDVSGSDLTMAPKRRRVAIVGTAPSSSDAPFDDKSWEIWGVGFRGEHVTRADRWYEIHNLSLEKDGKDWPPLFDKWSRDCDVWMFFPDQLPNIRGKTRQYPVEQILKQHSARFLSSSFAWMMAHALHAHEFGEQKVDEIGLWGVDMEYGTEYEYQRAGLFHFIEVAKHRGLTVRRVVTSGVVYEPLPYPFCFDDPLSEKLRFRQGKFSDELKTRQAAFDSTVSRVGQLKAVIDALGAVGLDTAKERAEKDLLERAITPMRDSLCELRGAIANVEWTLNYLRP